MEQPIETAKTISHYSIAGFLGGSLAGGSSAIVNSQSVLVYSLRSGVNCAILGCCVGGINEGLAFVRGGTRDPLNPAIACGVSGFLASVQSAVPKRAGFVGLLCAGAGAVGHYGWKEGMRRFELVKRQRRVEVFGLDEVAGEEEEGGVEWGEETAITTAQRKHPPAKELGLMRWAPVRPITDVEIAERRKIDAQRR